MLFNGNYIQFYDGIHEQLGSDGVCPLDGRLSVESMMNEAYNKLKSLRNVKPYLNGFDIYKRGRIVYSKRSIL